MHNESRLSAYKPDYNRYHDVQSGTSENGLQDTDFGLMVTHPEETRGAYTQILDQVSSAPVCVLAGFLAIKFL